MVYKAIITWADEFNSNDNPEEKVGVYMMADSYADAARIITERYGEDNVYSIDIAAWSPDSVLEFDFKHTDQAQLFESIDTILGETIMW